MADGQAVIHHLLRLRWCMSAAIVEAKARQLARLLKAGFDPNQPRVPAGSSDGGQWTRVGGPAPGSDSPEPVKPRAPLQITIFPPRPSGSGPLEKPPSIPKERPPTAQQRNRVAKAAARWLVKAAARQLAGPAGTVITIIEATSWLYDEFSPYIRSYLDTPKSLAELRAAAAEPKKGYDIHHIVEQTPAEQAGFPRSLINAPENLVRIPTFKHWEINAWYQTANKNYGGISPRMYLRDKDWQERVRVGIEALIDKGVMKP